MGFNNLGAEQAAARLANARLQTILGINIGKTKSVDVEQAVTDYVQSFRLLFPFARYFTVNVSSPEHSGLSHPAGSRTVIRTVTRVDAAESANGSADQQPHASDSVEDCSRPERRSNWRYRRVGSGDPPGRDHRHQYHHPSRASENTCRALQQIGAGGLSGKPLSEISRNVIRQLYVQTDRAIPLVGAGGIMSGEDAWSMICQGASLVQVYTGFVYGGPFFVKRVNRYLAQQLDRSGFSCIADAVGSQV